MRPLLLVVSPFPPPADGIAEHTKNLVNCWVLTHRVVILAPGDGRSDTLPVVDHNGETHDVVVHRILGGWKTRTSVREFIRNSGAQAMYCQYTISSYGFALASVHAAIAAGTEAGMSVICGLHEPEREPASLPILAAMLYRRVLRSGVHPVAFSERAGDAVREFSPTHPVTVLPHGVPVLPVPSDEQIQGVRTRYGNAPIVLGLGFTHHDKGTDLLVESARLDDGGTYLTLIAGTPRTRRGLFKVFGFRDVRYHRSLVRLASQLPVGRVRFAGFVPNDEMPALLAAASVVVLPYRSGSQSGIASLTVAAGRPSIASDLPGLREQLGDGALYVPVGDPVALAEAIAAVLTQNDVLRKLQSHTELLREQGQYPEVAVRILAAAENKTVCVNAAQ